MAVDGRDKASFRRWARENHPDVGGDAERFAEGVRALNEGRWSQFINPGPHEPPPVYVRRRPRGLAGIVARAKRRIRRNPSSRVR